MSALRLVKALVAAAALGALASSSGPAANSAQVFDGRIAFKPPTGEGSCDVDGVTLSYDAAFDEGTSYVAKSVTVRGISQTCHGATLTVRVGEAASTKTVTAAEEALTFAEPALASEVTRVDVTLDGGSLPIPSRCSAMQFDHVRIGTGSDDNALHGEKSSDIIFGLEGNDRISGANQADCIDGGAGNDLIDGGNQADVLLGGAGNDTIRGGNHNDVIDGGDGIDTCYGEGGNDTFHECETTFP